MRAVVLNKYNKEGNVEIKEIQIPAVGQNDVLEK